MKRSVLLATLFFAAACTEPPGTSLVEPQVQAPVSLAPSAAALGQAEVQADSWIVLFKPGTADPPGLARALVNGAGGRLKFTYRHTVSGFAATIPPQALQGIRNNPNVLRVEPDVTVSLVGSESAASWGLDRVDEHQLPMDGVYAYDTDGAGVTAYILDTGIRTTHDEFGGRAFKSSEADFIGGSGDDCHGHGTHVAGTVGGAAYGIAKAVTLQSVRVLDCTGSGAISGVIAGVDWVTGQHLSTGGPSVANMSLSAYDPFGFYPALNSAVAAAVDAGVVFAVAASNDTDDACLYTPASEPKALTVGATSSSDTKASFSNYGTCLDLFAPGVGITSSYYSSDDATATWSGTSMASPHVAGVAALYLGVHPSADAATVTSAILTNATPGVVNNAGPGSPNLLLYSRVTEGAEPPPDSPPAAPTDLSGTAVSTTQIDLSWTDNADNEDGFEIERSTDGATFNLVATLGANATSRSDPGLSADTEYWYRVQATNAFGGSGYSNTIQVTTPAEPAPEDLEVELLEGVPDAEVLRRAGKFTYYYTRAGVVEAGNPLHLVEGVTVAGEWWWSGDASPFASSTGVTDALGLMTAESGKTKANPTQIPFFCVTSLSGTGVVDNTTYPACSGGFTPPDPGDPGDPSDPGDPRPPSNLTATWTSKGGGRMELAWIPGGGAEVDVFRSSDGGDYTLIATTADNGKFNDRDAAVTGESYQVCIIETGPQDPDVCSNKTQPPSG